MRRSSFAVLGIWLVVAAFADIIATSERPAIVGWSPNDVDKTAPPLSPPDADHWLGTDASRRDVLARLVHGTRVTFVVGVSAAVVMLAVGLTLGVAAGYGSDLVDALVTRLTDAVLALPIFFVALAVMGVIAKPGLGIIVLAIGLSAWPPLARLVRIETRKLRTTEFVMAARAMGGSHLYVIARHIVPHLGRLLMVALAFGIASATLVEASLSFLGFGVPDTVASWGGLMRGAVQHLSAWWLIVVPGAALTSLVLACNALGDAFSERRGGLLSDRASA